MAAPALLQLCCCFLPRTSYRGGVRYAEASLPLREGDIVFAHIGPRGENWALGRVAAVAADGTVAVCFTDDSACSCAPELGLVEPAKDQCCGRGGGGGGRVVGTVAGFSLDRLQTAGHCTIQGPAVSQPKVAAPYPRSLDSRPAEGALQGVVVRSHQGPAMSQPK